MTTITIVDESMNGTAQHWNLEILDETMTVRELIKRRIYQEVTERNARQLRELYKTTQQTDADLNDAQSKSLHSLNWEAQYEQAITSFQRRGFILLVDEKQVSDPDAIITLHASSKVTFLKLVPLIGG